MQLVRKPKPKRPVRDQLQRSARAVVTGFAVDARSARQIILEAVDIGARHCGPLAVSTLCAMLSGKYAPAGENGARAAAEAHFLLPLREKVSAQPTDEGSHDPLRVASPPPATEAVIDPSSVSLREPPSPARGEGS